VQPYYEHGGIAIYHGDCRDFLLHLRADHLITDPPYGTDGDNGYGRRQLAPGDGRLGHRIANDGDLAVWREALGLIVPRLPKTAWACAWCSPRHAARRESEDIMIAAGLELLGEAIWDKGGAGLGYTLRYAHEVVLVARKGGAKTKAPLLSMLRARRSSRAIAGRHPHEKPVGVVWPLVALAGEGVILDPFCGRGSVLRAAKDQGLSAIGIELEERWCEMAAKLLQQEALPMSATEQLTIG
jgi:site-specific DNA-methyltransferase (adenine-specific)